MNAATAFSLARFRRWSWIAGGAGFFVWFVAAFATTARAFQAYWLAWLFWSGLGFGSLVLVMLHAVSGGAWGKAIRLPVRAGACTLPLMAGLLIPALFGLKYLFGWAGAAVAPEHLSPHQRAYLTSLWFIVRAFVYFAVLIGWSWWLGVWRRPEAEEPLPAGGRSGSGLVVYALLMLFASTDWIMSLDREWYSTMFVVIVGITHLLSALAFGVVFTTWLWQPPATLETKPLHDLGNLLLAFVIFWTYVTFSQFLIIWSGNLPREVSWYTRRSTDGWPAVAIALAVFQFAMPFVLLLFRALKRSARTLGAIAGLVLLANVIQIWWLVDPVFQSGGLRVPLLEVVALIAVGGLWFGFFLTVFAGRLVALPVEPGKEAGHA